MLSRCRSFVLPLLLFACAPSPVRAPASTPAYDVSALDHLRERAAAERSAALLVWVDGSLVVDESFGHDPRTPVFAMSVSKSIVALRIGQLVEQGALRLDEPLSARLLPEWADTDKASITLEHLLAHTSGLDPRRYHVRDDAAPDLNATIEGHAATIPLLDPPGTRFAYNNAAVDLLAVVARRADPHGLPLDDQLQQHLFGPMDIAAASWLKDGRGDPRAAGELMIRPHDLLALGRLVLDHGRHEGVQLVPAAWIDRMLAPGPNPGCGLLWWLDRREGDDEVAAYVADGYLGQYVVVIPSRRAVLVRMRDGNTTSWDPAEFSYPEFRHDALTAFE
ncbi:MAG: serine hydrolase domain-containing protein [Myxococcota bacterium]